MEGYKKFRGTPPFAPGKEPQSKRRKIKKTKKQKKVIASGGPQ
jgi:hypothetical protein